MENLPQGESLCLLLLGSAGETSLFFKAHVMRSGASRQSLFFKVNGAIQHNLIMGRIHQVDSPEEYSRRGDGESWESF